MFRTRIGTIRRDALGRLPAEDAEVTALRGHYVRGQKPARKNDLSAGVGKDQPNTPRDVARVEMLLEDKGFYDLKRTEGPTGIYGFPQDEAIKTFQSANGLKKDGLIFPGGETIRRLSDEGGEEGGDDEDEDEDEDEEKTPPPPPSKPDPEGGDKDDGDDEGDKDDQCGEYAEAVETAEAELQQAQGVLDSALADLAEAEALLKELEA
jgi:peptidoglycan hydrolase-like protein with peptidoglycan-binding domain